MKIKIPHISRKRLALLLILLVVLSLVVFIVVRQNKGDESPKPISNKNLCVTLISTADARQALDPLNPKRVQFLEPLVEKIRQVPGFEEDVDCLFPIVTYHIVTANKESAHEYFAKLEKAHAQRNEPSLFLKSGNETIEELRKQLAHVDVLDKQFEANRTFYGPPMEAN